LPAISLQVLEFLGDAALYLSRHIDSQVARKLVNETVAATIGHTIAISN